MNTRVDNADRAYRIVDGIYRLHRDLFEIEHRLIQTTSIQVRLARKMTNGLMGTFVVGLVAILPILIALGDIKLGSAPAITVYCLVAVVLGLWIYQVIAAGKLELELASFEGEVSPGRLEDRTEFVFEEVNAWSTRHRLIEGVLAELRAATVQATDDAIRREFEEKSKRYKEILLSCEDYIESLLTASERQVKSGKRSKEDHSELIDWCAAIPRFAERQGTVQPTTPPGSPAAGR